MSFDCCWFHNGSVSQNQKDITSQKFLFTLLHTPANMASSRLLSTISKNKKTAAAFSIGTAVGACGSYHYNMYQERILVQQKKIELLSNEELINMEQQAKQREAEQHEKEQREKEEQIKWDVGRQRLKENRHIMDEGIKRRKSYMDLSTKTVVPTHDSCEQNANQRHLESEHDLVVDCSCEFP